MAEFSAKDVQALRKATGAGMMDAKKALQEADGDAEKARKILREKGLAKADSRGDRENRDGVIAVASTGAAVALVELRSETDFVAKSDQFIKAAQELADAVAADGPEAADRFKDAIDDLRVTLKENIEVGGIARWAVQDGQVADTYLHRQEGRGVNGVYVVLSGGSTELAHDVAVHVAFTKPEYLRREEVPADILAEERETLTNLSRAEGKPEAALGKIVEGRLGGWFKDRVLLDQPFVRDDKKTIAQLVQDGGAEIVGYGQLYIGS